MSLEAFQLLRNVGQFDSVTAGAQIPLARLTVIYAENGRGKTTLSAVLRSVAAGDASLIAERHRLGATHAPHIVLSRPGGATCVFQNNAWSALVPDIAVFDDSFVSENICSGMEIAAAHRQNLHELILGARGVALNNALQQHVARIEEHNRELRARGEAISADLRGSATAEAFCALPINPNVGGATKEAERSLAAAKSADAIRLAESFRTLELPALDIDLVVATLDRTLPDLAAEAAASVKAHVAMLGRGGENWVGEGIGRIVVAPSTGQELCPFCAQDLAHSSLIHHFQAYFSEAYAKHRSAIDDLIRTITLRHGGDMGSASFERTVRAAAVSCEFWRPFATVPHLQLDTAEIARVWAAARDSLLSALRAKQSAPLEHIRLPSDAHKALEAYDLQRRIVSDLSATLQACNPVIALIKERTAAANIAALTLDLARLKAIAARSSAQGLALCSAYQAEKDAKAATEQLRDEARNALDDYRRNVFPDYQNAINTYLQRFNAGFRLDGVTSVNNRGGSSCTYSVLINNLPVALNSDSGPSFRNTLSAGDRNTLALAFFFASLDQEHNLAQKIVVVDDPMTSLDEHRSLTTVQEVRRLSSRARQVLVLSHSKSFLCALWEGADLNDRAAIRIARDGMGSTVAPWDVRQDSITEHDRRHELVNTYLAAANPATERAVAAALRPMLEAYMRIAYPLDFPPGSLLGPFITTCRQRLGTAREALNANDVAELRDLLDYANRFHHDTNPAWEMEAINDQELTRFCERTLRFTKRR